MNDKEIETELGKILKSAALGYPIEYPNGVRRTEKPRIKLEHEVVSRANPGLRPGGKILKGIWVLKVVVDAGTFSNTANDISAQIRALYPFGLSVPLSNAVLRVYKEPMPQSGFPTEASWCLPVHVHYMVTGK